MRVNFSTAVPIAVGCASAAACAWLWRRAHSTSAAVVSRVEELWVYPVKGMQGMSVARAVIADGGLEHDREWGVLVGGEVVSCNKFQQINTGRAVIRDDHLVLTAEGLEALRVPLAGAKTTPAETAVTIFGMSGVVADEGDEAAAWLRQLLPRAENPRLVRITTLRHPHDTPKHQNTSTPADRIGLHDYGAFHIICQSGVDWLQQRICSQTRLTTEQFRPNIVADAAMPFPDEDTWAALSIGECRFTVAKQSGRCVIPTTQGGVRDPRFEPTATLRRLRRCFHRHQLGKAEKEPCFMFGLDLFQERNDVGKEIAVGDLISITDRRAPPSYF